MTSRIFTIKPSRRSASHSKKCHFRTSVEQLEDRRLLSVLLQDDFNSGSLDPTKWTTNTNIDRGPASVSVQSGHVVIQNRGHLITTANFDPTVVGPLEITGTWVFGASGLPSGDFMQILTRSDGVPDNSQFGETAHGIEFQANANGNGALNISTHATGGGGLASTPMRLTAGTFYAFDIKDDGRNLSLQMTAQDGTGTTATVTAVSTLTFATNHIVFHNREANYGGDEVSQLDNVVVTAQAMNHPPVATDDAFSATLNQALSIPVINGVLANDTDADHDPLTASKVGDPSHGTVLIQSNGSFVYTPSYGFMGTDTFTYKTNDGQADSNVATVTITVHAINHPPVAGDDAYNVNQDTPLVVASGLLANDYDADSDHITAVKVGDPTHGTIALQANGSFVYTPFSGYVGTDSFKYKANDGQADSNLATVTITVHAINHPPVASSQTVSTSQEVAVSITLAASDIDGDSLTYQADNPSHGLLSGKAPNLTYTPVSGFFGTDSITYKVNDGKVDSNTVTVTIVVSKKPQKPQIVNGIVVDTTLVQNQNIITKLELGQRTLPIHAIVVHQTNGSSINSALSSYKTSGVGAHFLIDKEGVVYQTAHVNQIAAHVGRIRARWFEEHQKAPSKVDEAAAKLAFNPRVIKFNQLEQKKAYPVRYPSNQDAIGIELVGVCVPLNKKFPNGPCLYENATVAQNIALTRLVKMLKVFYGLTEADMYRHPQVSNKTASEAQSATWNYPGL